MISVVIPTYKIHHQMLQRSIDSVLKQSYTDYEIIVVDDNEKDSDWKKEIREYSEKTNNEKIHFLFRPDNGGGNAARNTGIEAAAGDIVAFLDSDDEWDEVYLEEVFKAYKSDDIVLTACEVIRLFPDNTQKTVITHKDGYIYDDLLFGDIVGPTSAVTVKRNALTEAGLFDAELPARQDFDMWLRVCRLGNVKYIRKPLAILHCDITHERISGNWKNREKGTRMVMNKLLSLPSIEENVKRDISAVYNKELGKLCFRNESFKAAREYLRESYKAEKNITVLTLYLASFFPLIMKAALKTGRKLKEIYRSMGK